MAESEDTPAPENAVPPEPSEPDATGDGELDPWEPLPSVRRLRGRGRPSFGPRAGAGEVDE